MSTAAHKLQVFLCHASQDKPAVRELYNALKSEDWIDPWLDKAKILPGQDWHMAIEKAVEESDVVIVCLSNKSISKEGFIQREIRYAYDIALEKPEETIFLIPLRLEECNSPRGLRTFQWVDYFGSEKKDHYSSLLEALRMRYEQCLPAKIEEAARKQREEKQRQQFEEYRRREQETARRLMEERERREAEERAKREAEMLARQELENRKPYLNAESGTSSNPNSFNEISEYPKKNNSEKIAIIITAIILCGFCSLLVFFWQYGEQILQSLGY